jgi:hypothetical protein
VNTAVLPAQSDRTTGVIPPAGSVSPGLSAAILWSFQLLQAWIALFDQVEPAPLIGVKVAAKADCADLARALLMTATATAATFAKRTSQFSSTVFMPNRVCPGMDDVNEKPSLFTAHSPPFCTPGRRVMFES